MERAMYYPGVLMQEAVDLVGHLVWPVTLLVVFVMLRRQIRQAADAIGQRMGDKSSDISITREGLRISSRLDALTSAVESQGLAQDVIAHTAMRVGEARLGEPGQPRPAVDEIPPELLSLADRYLAVSIPDWAERVRAKDDLALQMGSDIITHRTPRDLLAEQDHEGLLVGLASAINAVPEWGDAQRLIKASAKLTRLHVKYRFTMAFANLIQKRLLTRSELDSVQRVLDSFMEGADQSLRTRVEGTRSIAQSFAPEG
jgi:hypothetical protein